MIHQMILLKNNYQMINLLDIFIVLKENQLEQKEIDWHLNVQLILFVIWMMTITIMQIQLKLELLLC